MPDADGDSTGPLRRRLPGCISRVQAGSSTTLRGLNYRRHTQLQHQHLRLLKLVNPWPVDSHWARPGAVHRTGPHIGFRAKENAKICPKGPYTRRRTTALRPGYLGEARFDQMGAARNPSWARLPGSEPPVRRHPPAGGSKRIPCDRRLIPRHRLLPRCAPRGRTAGIVVELGWAELAC